ncbi:MAG TPA: uracil-DNA glycosylase [Methylomirabilota bacterium]|nr:uracil-DNA glycosylase [Methylomirabilota bacterium]
MSDAAPLLADTVRGLIDHLRFHQALGLRALPMQQEYLAGPTVALRRVEEAIAGCTRCKLAGGRTTIVFGSGDPAARLVLIGEGPGEEEDRQGKPFVGRAGQLLTKMLESVGISRDEVYICNIVKCRPPGNRNPEPDEIASCAPFLAGQLAAIRPGVICALGTFAAQTLLRTREPIGRLRGQLHQYGNTVLIPTFHPAFLLRNPGPAYRKQAYDDLKLVRREYDRVRGGGPARPA